MAVNIKDTAQLEVIYYFCAQKENAIAYGHNE